MSCQLSIPNRAQAHHFQNTAIIIHQEAKAKLKKLIPGTEEYQKLQNALLKTIGIAEISLSTGETYKINNIFTHYTLLGGFGSSEHVAIGEEIVLPGLEGEKTPTLIPKGETEIKFQHIVALAGDFYGVPGNAISLPGGIDEKKTERFEYAYLTLAEADNEEIRKLLLEINNECFAVKHSSLPHHCYGSQMMERNNAIKKIIKNFDDLLCDNSDHFSNNAEDAYRIGHNLAIRVAQEAGKRKDIKELKRAYALDAFACHFLTDLFSAGHIRNQRGKLESFLIDELKVSVDGIFPNNAKKLASLLTAAQHEKDGNEGLNVANKKGERWRAYGDGCLFTGDNKENKKKAVEATQKSVDEVYEAYLLTPKTSASNQVYNLIPKPTDQNPLPLYSIENGGKTLIIYQGNQRIEIKSYLDYLNIIPFALESLPADYVSGFFSIPNEIHAPPLLGKTINPLVQRIAGFIWNTIGLPSSHQVIRESQQINKKITEISRSTKSTHDNTEEILLQLKNIDGILTQSVLAQISQPIQTSVTIINRIIFQHASNGSQQRELELRAKELDDAQSIIAMHFEGEVGKKILATYQTVIAVPKDGEGMNCVEIKLSTTLWFRKILDHQAKAIDLWVALRIIEGMTNQSEIEKRVRAFQESLSRQIEASAEYIDLKLIFEREEYIAIQLEKSKTIRLAFRHLLNEPSQINKE